MWKPVLVWMLVCGCRASSHGAPEVNTPLGTLRGQYLLTRDNRRISAFTAIPYAQTPVGELRFKAPVPITAWEGTLDATRETPVCVQRNPYLRQQEIVGQEDCLYLNVYTPQVTQDKPEKLYPVMMFIHGGGWMCGDSTTWMYGPQYLLDQDVILVTTNYRLGPLGFLSTQDEHCPGNNGLKDQQEALRWIQANIASFGGDKDSVTIFGESAGGASVHFHMLSPTSKGLFHKGISESGTALVPWAEAPPGEALRNAFRLAKFLGCPQSPSEKMLACLRTKDAVEIIDTEFLFYEWDYEPMTTFKAVVEPDLPGAFLTKEARRAIKDTTVPWLTGLNKDEGCLKSVWITSNSSRYEEFISAFDAIAPITFYYNYSPQQEAITKKLKEVYFGESDEKSIHKGILEAYSDNYFNYPAIDAVERALQETKVPVYLYELTYRATNSFSQVFGDPEGDYGVCHADELMHLFPIYFLSKPFSQKDTEISKLIVTLWTNFAISGDPNKPVKIPHEWKPATNIENLEYLVISEEPKMSEAWAERARFWSSLPLWHKTSRRQITDEL